MFLIFRDEMHLFQRIVSWREAQLRGILLAPLPATAKSQTMSNPGVNTKKTTIFLEQRKPKLPCKKKVENLIQELGKAVEPTCSLQMPFCWPCSGVLVSFQKEARTTTHPSPKSHWTCYISHAQGLLSLELCFQLPLLCLRFPN